MQPLCKTRDPAPRHVFTRTLLSNVYGSAGPISQEWTRPKCCSPDECMNGMCSVRMTECGLAIKGQMPRGAQHGRTLKT